MHPQKRIPVAVLGATGMVGQRFIELLQGHPWFELVALAASDQHEGRAYAEVAKWRLSGIEMPVSAASLPVVSCNPEALPVDVKIAFQRCLLRLQERSKALLLARASQSSVMQKIIACKTMCRYSFPKSMLIMHWRLFNSVKSVVGSVALSPMQIARRHRW